MGRGALLCRKLSSVARLLGLNLALLGIERFFPSDIIE